MDRDCAPLPAACLAGWWPPGNCSFIQVVPQSSHWGNQVL